MGRRRRRGKMMRCTTIHTTDSSDTNGSTVAVTKWVSASLTHLKNVTIH